MSVVSYGRYEAAWEGYEGLLWDLIDTSQSKAVCEIGGGANPLLARDALGRRGIHYTILDISEDELRKTRMDCHRIVADITDPDLSLPPQFDLVFTRMLAEHVRDGGIFHRNVRRILKPGGLAAHFFPTLYALPFVVNRVTSEWLSGKLVDVLAPRDRFQYGKFPASYSWCRGPTSGMLTRLRGLGYDIVLYKGFFGHGYYRRMPVLRQLHGRLTPLLVRHPLSYLTSYAWLVLRKRHDG